MSNTAINLILAFYVIPMVWCYISTQLSYKHVFSNRPHWLEIFLLFCPLFNIIAAWANTYYIIEYFNKKRDAEGVPRRTIPERFFRTEVKK